MAEITPTEQIIEMRTIILGNATDSSKDDIFAIYLKRAKNRYLNLVYPFDKNITELPDDRAKEWQTNCAIELYKLGGDENIIAYSENGLSESYSKAGLSDGLLSQLPPAHGKVVAKNEQIQVE